MRLPDWENRLNVTISEWSNKPFRWDRDCGRWAADCVISITGKDPLIDLRGQYRTKRAALKLLVEKSMTDRLDEMFPRIHSALAQRGDIALTQENCLGCVLGGDALFYFEDGGMTRVPRSAWQGVWGIGRG